MVIGARLTYTDPPTPVLVLKGVRAPPWHTPCTFAPESNQILAISSLPLLCPSSLSLSLRDLPPTLAGKRCPFECTIPLPTTIYRAEDIMGLGFQGKAEKKTRSQGGTMRFCSAMTPTCRRSSLLFAVETDIRIYKRLDNDNDLKLNKLTVNLYRIE